MNIIEIRNLSKYFGHFLALNEINLTVEKGEFLTIFGPNGAGKTTLIRILSTLLRATKGEVKISGLDLNKEEVSISSEKLRYLIGVISHNTFLYDNLTARENLYFYGKMYDFPNLEKRIDQLLTELGLKKRENDLVRTFSRGMQQRLSIARALIHNPPILLLDEPYTGLDQHASRILKNLLNELHTEERTIILTTHNLAQGLESSERVTVLVSGRIVYQEETKKITPQDFEKTYFDLVERKDDANRLKTDSER